MPVFLPKTCAAVARRPAASLDAEGVYRRRLRMRRQRQVGHDRPILLPALDDVACLQEEPLVRPVLDFERVDLGAILTLARALLAHGDQSRVQSFIQREVLARIDHRPTNHVHGEVVMRVGSGDREGLEPGAWGGSSAFMTPVARPAIVRSPVDAERSIIAEAHNRGMGIPTPRVTPFRSWPDEAEASYHECRTRLKPVPQERGTSGFLQRPADPGYRCGME